MTSSIDFLLLLSYTINIIVGNQNSPKSLLKVFFLRSSAYLYSEFAKTLSFGGIGGTIGLKKLSKSFFLGLINSTGFKF